MELKGILDEKSCKVPLDASDKAGAIRELVDLLAQNGKVENADNLYHAVMEREKARTTGIGGGLAIPHGKCAGTKSLAMAVGKPKTPIDFDSVDKHKVKIVFLLASAPDQTGPHIQALARISRMMTTDAFRLSLFEADSAEKLYQAIVNHQ